jgi:hypothetical protein
MARLAHTASARPGNQNEVPLWTALAGSYVRCDASEVAAVATGRGFSGGVKDLGTKLNSSCMEN